MRPQPRSRALIGRRAGNRLARIDAAPAAARRIPGRDGDVKNPLVKANSMLFEQVNKVVPWHELPRPLALLNLRAFRDDLRE